jgi:hypothetical protein
MGQHHTASQDRIITCIVQSVQFDHRAPKFASTQFPKKPAIATDLPTNIGSTSRQRKLLGQVRDPKNGTRIAEEKAYLKDGWVPKEKVFVPHGHIQIRWMSQAQNWNIQPTGNRLRQVITETNCSAKMPFGFTPKTVVLQNTPNFISSVALNSVSSRHSSLVSLGLTGYDRQDG